MKRDMDLVRAILQRVEEGGPDSLTYRELQFEGRHPHEVAYHVVLLDEAGLVRGFGEDSERGPTDVFAVHRLTWAGHEFLDAARDPKLWAKAMHAIGGKLASVPFEVLTAYLIALAKEKLLGPGAS